MNVSVAVQTDQGLMVPVVQVMRHNPDYKFMIRRLLC